MRYDSLQVRVLLVILAALVLTVRPVVGDESTQITSDSLDYDAEQRRAVFSGNVVVADPQMNINSERLTVVFADDHGVKMLQAEGDVVIIRGDTVGTGALAVYDVEVGKIVLSGEPRVRHMNDELIGETITFYRGTGRMVCEPNAVLRMQAMPQMQGGEDAKPAAEK